VRWADACSHGGGDFYRIATDKEICHVAYGVHYRID